MYEILANDEAAYEFLSAQIPMARSDFQKGIVQKKNGVVNAAVLYTSFNGTNIMATIAGTVGTRWLTRDFLYWIFHYPFVQLNVKRVTVSIYSDNLASVRFAKHCGFTHEATLHGAASDGQDVLLFCLWRKDCRFGNANSGQ
jgi:hypothetical protein